MIHPVLRTCHHQKRTVQMALSTKISNQPFMTANYIAVLDDSLFSSSVGATLATQARPFCYYESLIRMNGSNALRVVESSSPVCLFEQLGSRYWRN